MAVDAAGLFGKPFDEGGTIADFAAGFVQRLALFGGEDQREILDILDHQIEPLFNEKRALRVGLRLPALEGGLCRDNRRAGLLAAHVGHAADGRLRGRIDDIDRLAGARGDPFAVDEAGLAD